MSDKKPESIGGVDAVEDSETSSSRDEHLEWAPSRAASQSMDLKRCGVAKVGSIVGGFHPLKSKKAYYAVLKDRVLEVYKSLKDEKNGKEPKYLFDLSTAFNIHMHYDPVLKDCVSLMLPDETFLFRADPAEVDANEWYSQTIEKARQARATKLGRPVFREEYFEVAWDVEMVKLPKLKKKQKNEEKMEDIVAKYDCLLGKKRLCMYPQSILIVKKGVSASDNSMPPLQPDEFMEFPINAVSNFGKQEKYFFLRVGRCSATGAGELWLCADNGEYATSIYERINKICERESEKRKMQGSRLSSFTVRSRSQAYRDRCHAQAHRSQHDNGRPLSSVENPRKTSRTSVASAFASQSLSACATQTISSLIARSNSLGTNLGTTLRSVSSPKSCNIKAPVDEFFFPPVGEMSDPKGSSGNSLTRKSVLLEPVSGSSIFNDEESSGGTIMYIGDRDGAESQHEGVLKPKNGLPKCVEDYEQMDRGCTEVQGASGSTPFVASRLKTPPRAIFPSQSATLQAVSPSLESEYTPMDCISDSSHPPSSSSDVNFNLTEVRSYVSDSTESCHSSGHNIKPIPIVEAKDSQRAYSLGSRPLLQASAPLSASRSGCPKLSDDVADESSSKNSEDPRKRAHSLGSKSWLKSLRKSAGIRSSNESAESNGLRQRSDSFGSSNGLSGGSLAASFSTHRDGRKNNRVSSGDRDREAAEDLAEWDFTTVPVGRSGSSSMASIESPCQSRTSSFGVANTALLKAAVEKVLVSRGEKSSDKLTSDRTSWSDIENVHDKFASIMDDDSDYVMPSFPTRDHSDRSPVGSARNQQRLIETIPEQNVSSGSSPSISPNKSRAPSIEDSTSPIEIPKKHSSVDDQFPSSTVFFSIHPDEVPKSVLLPKDEPTQLCTSDGTGKATTSNQLDYACLDRPADVPRKIITAKTIQSGILQVAMPKFYEYSVVEAQKP